MQSSVTCKRCNSSYSISEYEFFEQLDEYGGLVQCPFCLRSFRPFEERAERIGEYEESERPSDFEIQE